MKRYICIDTEFFDSNEETMTVVCAVLHEDGISTKFDTINHPQTFQLHMSELAKDQNVILVAFMATAESRALLSLNIDPLQFKWIDLYVENIMLCNSNHKYAYGEYLQANYLVVDGQSNATGINFKQYSSVSFNGDGYTAMGPVSVDKMFFNFAQGSNIFKIFYFDVSGITGNATRAYTMPNSDGTLALTSQIPTVSGTTNYIPKFTSSSAIGNRDT